MNKEEYRIARAHKLACIAAFEFSSTIEKLKSKDYDRILDLMVACYDAGFTYATKHMPVEQTITFEFPNMNKNNNEEV